jgi:hypothetical protein
MREDIEGKVHWRSKTMNPAIKWKYNYTFFLGFINTYVTKPPLKANNPEPSQSNESFETGSLVFGVDGLSTMGKGSFES